MLGGTRVACERADAGCGKAPAGGGGGAAAMRKSGEVLRQGFAAVPHLAVLNVHQSDTETGSVPTGNHYHVVHAGVTAARYCPDASQVQCKLMPVPAHWGSRWDLVISPDSIDWRSLTYSISDVAKQGMQCASRIAVYVFANHATVESDNPVRNTSKSILSGPISSRTASESSLPRNVTLRPFIQEEARPEFKTEFQAAYFQLGESGR
jgi:hypothetical protein